VSELRFLLPMDVAELPSARGSVRSFLTRHPVPAESIESIVLCIQEALKNAIGHSGTAEHAEVHVSVKEQTVRATVRDSGVGFGGLSVADPSSFKRQPDPLSESGRGMFLIATLMDEIRLCSNDGAEVQMVKRFQPRRPAGEESAG
jgi:serine/threonine-protein kinase RsbW